MPKMRLQWLLVGRRRIRFLCKLGLLKWRPLSPAVNGAARTSRQSVPVASGTHQRSTNAPTCKPWQKVPSPPRTPANTGSNRQSPTHAELLMMQCLRKGATDMKKTYRGFNVCSFQDLYGATCSLQKSSLATEDAIWLGVDDADPKIMSSVAIRMGIKERTFTESDNGWTPFFIPQEVSLNTRMHLSRKQVAKLLPLLQKFVETGEI